MAENILSPIKKWAEKHNENSHKLKTGLAGFHCPVKHESCHWLGMWTVYIILPSGISDLASENKRVG